MAALAAAAAAAAMQRLSDSGSRKLARPAVAGGPTWVHAVGTGHCLCVRNQLVALQCNAQHTTGGC